MITEAYTLRIWNVNFTDIAPSFLGCPIKWHGFSGVAISIISGFSQVGTIALMR